jgi:soluble epoxide hydrolase/lipid-phosphate phosphatase
MTLAFANLRLHRSPNLTINIPAMYIDTTKSALIPSFLLESSKQYLPHLTSRSVNTEHWAMLEDPIGVNKHIKEWVEQVVFGDKQKL